MGGQSVSNIILRFPNFHHQYWNKDMFLTTRLHQICIHPHQILKEKTYLQTSNDILKESVQRSVYVLCLVQYREAVLSKGYKAYEVSYMRQMWKIRSR